MNITKQKDKLRKQLLHKRLQLNEETYLRKSTQIIERLKTQPEFINAAVVHCYVSMNSRNEVNTLPLIKELLQSAQRLVVPVTNVGSGSLSHVYLTDFGDLKENKWGVPEPKMGEQADPKDLDLVIVPMAGGDHQKNRIGYGKGFYDRFLDKINCPTVGMLFECCLVDSLPVENFDIPLSKILTEKQVIA